MNIENIKDEKHEIKRAVQDLMRDGDAELTYDEVFKAFKNAEETDLTDDIWEKLENTESNEIEAGDMEKVMFIAKMYKKTNPETLAKAIKSGEYKRPMILNYNGDRYVLVAGNTRLCTAAALGITPKVYIAIVDTKQTQTDEQYDDPQDETLPPQETNVGTDWRKKGKKGEQKEMTGASSAGAYAAPLFATTKKKLQETMDASQSGQFDVPAFGTSTKGRKSPLKIDGPESIYKGRAVKDKKFPKWGGPDSVFVKVKEKCKKFPYCNQGDINAIQIMKEDVELQDTIKIMSEKYNIPVSQIENIVLNEINKIFI